MCLSHRSMYRDKVLHYGISINDPISKLSIELLSIKFIYMAENNTSFAISEIRHGHYTKHNA